ncbi:MAG: hypothetical protein IKW28_09945 [Lachnospiraceae bacterium]|nr:hypothetical protein [Lachnospiraceae bacterium]
MMSNFWDSNVWGCFNLIAILLTILIVASLIKKKIPLLKESLIPTSVLGGGILLLVGAIYKVIFKINMFQTDFFGANGIQTLEIITYHTLALGFIASTFSDSSASFNKKRQIEIFNTGVTTVATYLMQGILGFGITLGAAFIVKDIFPAAGLLLPFGYGQGTGQALNYGNIYETDFGFIGGKSFGLTIAALGFLSASIGGVIYLSHLKKKNKLASILKKNTEEINQFSAQENSIELFESMDTLSVQISFIMGSYLLTFLSMKVLGGLLPGLKSVIFGFNFLLGVIMATIVKFLLNYLQRKRILKKVYLNSFLMTRVRNFFFDIMVVAGIAAIQLHILNHYFVLMIILGILGLLFTYAYNYLVAKILFPEYPDEQFLAMYGMLTGTASTGIILLREVDPDFKSPASDNLVYQNFPAIVFGFPLMLLATTAPVKPFFTLGILFLFFLLMNLILFREQIFRKK